MQATHDDTRTRFDRGPADRGPAIYYGYCGRTRRYRMMDLPDYVSNLQQGMTRLMSDPAGMYQEIARGYSMPGAARPAGVRTRTEHDCDCGCGCRGDCDCHCECCVCDADVLVHARCNETRRIPVTFENDTRREKPVKLTLEKFVSAGGKDVGWNGQLSQAEFTLKPCDEHTIIVTVQVKCDSFGGGTTPGTTDSPNAAARRGGTLDRCEVAYATLCAEGCLVRPVVIAVAVLRDDCDTYRRPCSCGCCH
jgi:hypothetical protein